MPSLHTCLVGAAMVAACAAPNEAFAPLPAQPAGPKLVIDEAALAALGEQIEAQCEAGTFSGGLHVRVGSDLIFAKACSPDADASPDSDLYKIFSTSKTLTGVATLSLAQDGLLSLDAPITDYLKTAPKIWSAVTVGQLLNHSSGIPDHTGALLGRWTEHDAQSYDEAMTGLLEALAETETALASPPGAEWKYSNFGYELLALIASEVAGMPFDDVLANRVFAPAGMTTAEVAQPLIDSGEVTGSAPVAALITGYNGEPGSLEEATSYSFVQWGAGAVLASLADMDAFAAAMDAGELVDPAFFDAQLVKAKKVNDNVAYGPGVMLRMSGDCRVLQHSGGTNGYISDLSRLPDLDASVVVMSNYGFAQTRELSKAAIEALTSGTECH